jgi:hypothetical protein
VKRRVTGGNESGQNWHRCGFGSGAQRRISERAGWFRDWAPAISVLVTRRLSKSGGVAASPRNRPSARA